jgi:hypothetical protein
VSLLDKLSQDAAAALAAGMTYGKWKGLQYEKGKVPVLQNREKEIPDGWLVCQHCGKPFLPKDKRKKKYCDDPCRVAGYQKQNREKLYAYKREWIAKQKEGKED